MAKANFNDDSRIVLLVKFLKEEEWADELIAGSLYLNRVSWFKTIEQGGDRFEAATGHIVPQEGVSFTIDGFDMTQGLISATIQADWVNHYHLFCVYMIHTGDLEIANIHSTDLDRLVDQFAIPQRIIDEYGPFAVVIKSWAKFCERVKSAAESSGYRHGRSFVRYYDPNTFSGIFEDEDALFSKRSGFADEQEYRFAFFIDSIDDLHRRLEIGDISDIAVKMPADQINATISADLRNLQAPNAEEFPK